MKTCHMILTAAFVLTLAACTTMGTGVGSTPRGDLRAVISWKSMSDRDGVMTAMLSNGETYSGMFFQITSETRLDTLDPLWVGWARPWSDWAYLGPEPVTGFVTHYSGRVVANLEGPNGTHMRCDFSLSRPASGMAGGGVGTCQLPNGRTIDATFPPQP